MAENRRNALITGAARGIGRAISITLAELGFNLILCDIDTQKLEQLSSELSQKEIWVKPIDVDLSNESEISSMLTQLKEESIHIDVLVNNAGITRDSLLIRMKPEDWEAVLKVNLSPLFYMSRYLVRGMMRKRWGRIVSISSVTAFMGNAGQTNYTASKAAVVGFSRSLAREVAIRNVTVNCVAPGYIDTEMTQGLSDDIKAKILSMIPLNRLGNPQDVANVVAFLVSDEASYITGQVLHVNGGLFT